MFLFNKKSIGLNIADFTIEVVELVKSKGKIKVSSQGRIKLKPGIVQGGRIKDEEKLRKAIKEALVQAKPNPIITKSRSIFDKLWGKKIIFGLPENQVYTHIFELKKHSEDERDKLVLKEAQSSIPLKKDNLLFSYRVLNENKGRVEVLLVATSRQVAIEWQKFWQKFKIGIEFFDIETLANFRGCFDKALLKPVCLVDIGAVTTNITIFDKKGLRYSYSINIAGNSFTREIAKSLKIKVEEAEKMKIKLGLSNPSEKIFSILVKSLELILEEIGTAIKYFKKKTNQEAGGVILLGGSSKLKKIVEFFKTNLDLPVHLGESRLLPQKASIEFITAIGLALKGLSSQWLKRDPAIYLSAEKQDSKKVGEKKEKAEPVIKNKNGLIRPLISELENSKKLRFKIILLSIVLVVGAVTLAMAFWYRSHSREQRESQLKTQLEDYSITQSFDLKITVATQASEYKGDRTRGRVIEDIISSGKNYQGIVDQSKITVEKELQEGEKLWLEPISESPKEIIFPLTIKWLVYSEKDANKFFLQELDKLNKEETSYILNNIEKNVLKTTENSNVFYLKGTITVSLNQLIEMEVVEEDLPDPGLEASQDIAEEIEEEEAIEEAIETITIKDTETGWLNVREGPGTNYTILTKVYPGEIYPLLEESLDWYKIELKDKQEGWIFSIYSIK